MRLRFSAALLIAVSCSFSFARFSAAAEATPLTEEIFELKEDAEVIATITATCAACKWSEPGREAAVLRLEVDGRYSQHVFLVRGQEMAPYRVMLGPLSAGKHRLTLTPDSGAWAGAPRGVSISRVNIVPIGVSSPDHAAMALAPILYARPNTVGRFTDVPLLMWYETEKTERGTRIRYSVVFSNEDGGTPANRLLATWGRLTDLEYVYGIEVDGAGRVIEETFQGKDHQIVAFQGKREGRHPLLYVVTENNMVKDTGQTQERFAPAPVLFDLADASREKVMDENPWTYAVTAQEARREGRVAIAPTPGSKQIVDPRRYAVVELCTASNDTTFSTFTFAIGVSRGTGATRFHDSTAGSREFKISRSPDNFPNSCFRGAVALPKGAKALDVTALQIRAHARPPRKGEEPAKAPTGPAHLRRINRIFLMSEADLPESSFFSWTGNEPLALGGEPVTLQIRPTRATQK